MKESLPSKIHYAVNDFLYAVRSFQMRSWKDIAQDMLEDWEGNAIFGLFVVAVIYYLWLIFG